MNVSEIIVGVSAFVVGIISVVALYVSERKKIKRLDDDVQKAEKAAYEIKAEEKDEMGLLFSLYSRQIEKYQQQTLARATWSFVFAIISMFAGLGFIIWGGAVLLKAKDQAILLAAGGLIAAIGGGVGGYITKTFLDVHKLSLNQLNRYFRQPVINDHILMAKRLADEFKDQEVKKASYNTVIDSIAQLIKQLPDQPSAE